MMYWGGIMIIRNKFFGKYIHLFCWFSIVIFLYFLDLNYLQTSYSDLERQILIMSWIGNLILLGAIYSLKRINGTVITPYLLWLVIFFLFCSGHFFLYSIGIRDNTYFIFDRYSLDILYQALL